MALAPDALGAILAIGAAAYACRIAGYWAMGFVQPGPRIAAWLEAVPMAILAAILAPAAAKAGVPEAAGFAMALLAMRLVGNDLLGAAAGVAAVALMRAALG